VILDDYSRAVAGYFLFFEASSAAQTALALRQAIWRKDDHAAQPSESHGSRNRLHWRKSVKQPTRHTAAKKRPPSEGSGSDSLFDNFLQFPDFRSTRKLTLSGDMTQA
jgi:hypothetical protein